ncbi:MAG: hypothetical protein K1X67_19570 [Fimbriimonadaceae bacterium]|nr:hypothetical protein [Fimbriimonadaceae bacterium]
MPRLEGEAEVEYSGSSGEVSIVNRQTALGTLWRGTLRHSHVDDGAVTVIAQAELVVPPEGPGSVVVSIRLERKTGDIRPLNVPISAPRVVRDLIETCRITDATEQLMSIPARLDAGAVDDLVALIGSTERSRPVILVSHDARSDRRYVDEKVLARELAGIAHVYFTIYGVPSMRLSEQLGREFSAWGGAVRIWWPGFCDKSSKWDHPLILPESLKRSDGATDGDRAARRVANRVWPAAVGSMSEPELHVSIRRELRSEALRDADVSDEWIEAFEQEEKARIQAEELVKERDKDIANLQYQLETLRKYPQSVPEEDDNGPDPLQLDTTASTVLEAVEKAERLTSNLEFHKRSYASAEESPFENPSGILDALVALDRLAGMERRPGGIGGPRDEAARQLGLQWRGGVSSTARGKRSEAYSIEWGGERRELGPHVCLGSGSGAGKIARIYFYCHESEDPRERCYVVGHVGRKLPDTTT